MGPKPKDVHCRLCGHAGLMETYSGVRLGEIYRGYYCSYCDVYQTVDDPMTVSPQYVALSLDDLTDDHLALQTTHKLPAFEQWLRLQNPDGKAPIMGRLLDVGCGIGGFLDFAQNAGLEVYGFDASAAQIQFAQRRHSRVRQAETVDQFMALMPHEIKFDFVTMWDVLEHVRQPRVLLRQIAGVMNPGGKLFVSVPGGGLIPARILLSKLIRRPPDFIPWEHVFYYTPKSLEKVMADSGLCVETLGAVTPYPRKLGFHEIGRRIVFRALRNTRWALQLFASCVVPKP